jgi:hypothetical protein
MPTPPNDKAQVERYRKTVLEYEALDREIDALLMANNGATEEMSAEELAQYRDLAQRRDERYNQLKALERQLFKDDSEKDQ